MAVTLEQLKKATYQDVVSSPELQKAFDSEGFNLSGRISSGALKEQDFNNIVKPRVFSQLDDVLTGEKLAVAYNQYSNWNNPNMADNTPAMEARTKGLSELEKLKQDYLNRYGIDISGYGGYQKYSQGFGADAGGGQTADKSAELAGKGIDPTQQNNNNVDANGKPLSMAEANDPKYYQNDKFMGEDLTAGDEGIAALVASGRPFTKTDAQNYAYAKGENNWQKYVGGISGQSNPLYIGANNYANLQKQYTPYQLEQATIRTNDGIFWNENVNISEIPKKSPEDQINDDAKTIADIITSAKKEADPYTKESEKGTAKKDKPTISDNIEENQDTMMKMLQGLYGDSAESLYKELYNTEEMNSAKEDVIKYKNQLDEYDDQIDELKQDIRREVEGEASEGYISALATIRGGNILKLQKQAQRGYETASAILTNAREEASNLLQVKMADSNNRYNRLFQNLQLQIQQQGTAFNQEMAITNLKLQMPEGRSVTFSDGTQVKGMKENDNLNVIQFTDANKNTYVIGIDKLTGEEKYKQFIGKSSSGVGATQSSVKDLAEYEAEKNLAYQKEIDQRIEKGEVEIAYDEKGNSYYYDKKKFDEDEANRGWFEGKKKKIDYRL